jgi:hypothetical protein
MEKETKSRASDAAPDALLGALDTGRTSGDYAALQPLWNRASDAPTSSHRMMGEHCLCILWSGDVGSLAKLNMNRMLECLMVCRQTRSVHQNRLWTPYWTASDASGERW